MPLILKTPEATAALELHQTLLVAGLFMGVAAVAEIMEPTVTVAFQLVVLEAAEPVLFMQGQQGLLVKPIRAVAVAAGQTDDFPAQVAPVS
jgi:hypothetical protein